MEQLTLLSAEHLAKIFQSQETIKGLDGEQSRLAYEFVRLVKEIHPRWLLWENVPGCLTTNGGNDFKSFIGALHECGFCLSWRILDAQFFGTPQRRRRVFVVGHSGNIANPLKVLFESYSLPRDIEAIRKEGQETTGTLTRSIGTHGNSSAARQGLIVPVERESRNPDQSIRQARQHLQRCSDGRVAYRRLGQGHYKHSDISSTVCRRDYKDATDLIVDNHAPA